MMKQVLVLMLSLLSTTAGDNYCNGMICPGFMTMCSGRSTDVNGVQIKISRCFSPTGRIEKERVIIKGDRFVFLGSIMCIMLREMVNGEMTTSKVCQDKNGNEEQMTPEQEAIFMKYLDIIGWSEEEEKLDDMNRPWSKEEKERFKKKTKYLKNAMDELGDFLDDFMDDMSNRWSEEEIKRFEEKIVDLKHMMDDLREFLDDFMDDMNKGWSKDKKMRLEKKIDDLEDMMDDFDDFLDDFMDNMDNRWSKEEKKRFKKEREILKLMMDDLDDSLDDLMDIHKRV